MKDNSIKKLKFHINMIGQSLIVFFASLLFSGLIFRDPVHITIFELASMVPLVVSVMIILYDKLKSNPKT